MIVFTWGFQAFIKMNSAPPDAYEIVVRGGGYQWNFEYPNGAVMIRLVVCSCRYSCEAEDEQHRLFAQLLYSSLSGEARCIAQSVHFSLVRSNGNR